MRRPGGKPTLLPCSTTANGTERLASTRLARKRRLVELPQHVHAALDDAQAVPRARGALLQPALVQDARRRVAVAVLLAARPRGAGPGCS